MSITIDISDDLLAEVGREKIEQEIADTVRRIAQQQRRARGKALFSEEEIQEMLADLAQSDLINDPAFTEAREAAWVSYRQMHNLKPDGQRND